MATPFTTFPIPTTFAVAEWGLAVNVKDFGAIGDGAVDDTAAIQAAIDYCYTTRFPARVIFVPGGRYKTTLPIFVDPPLPASLRGDGNFYPPAWSSATTYAANAKVSYLGVPWISLTAGNINNTPVLPPKAMSGAKATGDKVEWKGKYWIALQTTNVNNLFNATPGHWAEATIYWRIHANETPNVGGWAATLLGDEGLGGQGGGGSVIYPTFNDTVAIWSCHGNGNTIKNIGVSGPQSDGGGFAWNYRKGQPAGGVGIGIPGYGAGASRTLIENCEIYSFRTGIQSSPNADALGDSNMIFRTHILNCGIGIELTSTQAFINSVMLCNISCTDAITALVGQDVRVYGGNYSCNFATSGSFTVSAINATALPTVGRWTLNVSVTVAAPTNGTEQGYRDDIDAGIFEYFFIETAHFGVVPFTVVSWNTSTAVLELTALVEWYSGFSFQGNPATDMGIEAEIEAATTVYGTELPKLFHGSGFNVDGIFLEQTSGAPTQLINATTGFGSDPPCKLANVFYDSGAIFGFIADAHRGEHYASVLVGHVIVGSAPVTIELGCLGCSEEPPVTGGRLIFDTKSIGGVHPLTMRGNKKLNAQCRTGSGRALNTYENFSRGLGGGNWDSGRHFNPSPNQAHILNSSRDPFSITSAPQWGYRPASWTTPLITIEQVAALSGTLPALTPSSIYPTIWGGQIYKVANEGGFDGANGTVQRQYQVVSKHRFYTYGQDLTTTNIPGLSWSYKGKSYCLYVSCTGDTVWHFLMPGLGITLNTVDGDQNYIISMVFPTLGYVTVEHTDGSSYLIGDKNTVFTGSTIKQQPFSIQVLSGPNAAVTKTADFSPTPLESNIIVNKGSSCSVTLPSAATYDGRSITIKTIQAFTVVSASSNVVPQAGGSAGTAILAATAGKWAQLVANGTNWEIIQSN